MARPVKNDQASDVVQIDWGKLPALSALEHAFILGVLHGKPLVDAFREAYGDSVSHYSEHALANRAMRDFNEERLQICFNAMLQSFMGSGDLNKETHLRQLERIRERALNSQNFGAAIQAEQSRGKAAGLYVDKIEDVTPREPVQLLRDIAKHSPDLARTLAKGAGIPWENVEGRPVPLQALEHVPEAEPEEPEAWLGEAVADDDIDI